MQAGDAKKLTTFRFFILVALPALGAAIGPVYDAWIDTREYSTAIGQTLKVLNARYKALCDIRYDTSSVRALILKGHNGGRPHPDRPFHSSVFMECKNREISSVKEGWQNRLIDRAYTRYLLDIYNEGELTLYTELMEPGILKDVYEVQGVKKAILYRISISPIEMFYLSVTFKHTHELTTPERLVLNEKVQALRNLFGEHN